MVLLENVAGAIGASGLSGSGLTTQTGGLAGFDPVLISLIRRAMPNSLHMTSAVYNQCLDLQVLSLQ